MSPDIQESQPSMGSNQSSEGQSTKPATKQSQLRMFFMGLGVVAIIVLAALIGLGFRATRHLADDAMTLRFANTFGIAAARVNGASIPYGEYISELAVLKKVYASAPAGVTAPTADKMSDDVLGNLLINQVISSEAAKFHVNATQADVEQSDAYKGIMQRFNNDPKAAEKEIMTRYGLTLSQYVDKAIRPILLEQKLREAFEKSTDDAGKAYSEDQIRASHILIPVADFKNAKDVATAKKKAQDILLRVKKGEDFATLAKQFGTDGTKDVGGDLGWFGPGQMVKEFEQAVWNLPVGSIGPDVVQTQYGFHVVKVTDRRSGRNYTKYMADIIRKANVQVLLPVHNPFTDIKNQLDAQANAGNAAVPEQSK